MSVAPEAHRWPTIHRQPSIHKCHPISSSYRLRCNRQDVDCPTIDTTPTWPDRTQQPERVWDLSYFGCKSELLEWHRRGRNDTMVLMNDHPGCADLQVCARAPVRESRNTALNKNNEMIVKMFIVLLKKAVEFWWKHKKAYVVWPARNRSPCRRLHRRQPFRRIPKLLTTPIGLANPREAFFDVDDLMRLRQNHLSIPLSIPFLVRHV